MYSLRWCLCFGLFAGCVVPLELLGPPDAGQDAGAQLLPAVTLTVGSSQTCTTTANGTLYCFGDNVTGQLGVGDTTQHPGPTRVDGGTLRWVAAAIGERHTCALATDAVAYCWGANAEGALGLGDAVARLVPARSLGAPYSALTAGDGFTCALKSGGELFCWGANGESQLGFFDLAKPGAPSLQPLRVGAGLYRQVAAGQGHACALGVDGGLECWGRNTEGQLGSGSALGNVPEPSPVINGPWLSVAATQGSTCAIRADRTLWCWGEGPSGTSRTPVRVEAASDWAQISVNQFHYCGRRGASLYCWGRGIEGQLGLNDNSPRAAPTQVMGAWTTVGASRFHTCGIQTDGRLYCWGRNEQDQLGLKDSVRRSVPTLVPLP